MKNRLRKRRLYATMQAFKLARQWMTEEEYAWEFMSPVGREFGSPDYEQLTAPDVLQKFSNDSDFK
jgi:DNA-dependent RNA polymerase auxiliary subunit epsilon